MSQLPPFNPPPPGFGSPNNFGPPTGAGGMRPPGFPMNQSPRTSAAAVTSLICGIICCVTPITPIIAIICGIVGIGSTRNPMVRGRGMAITGLILGILALLTSIGAGISGATWYSHTAPQRALAHQVINDLNTGNVSAVAAVCTSAVKQDEIQSASDDLQQSGSIQRMVAWPISAGSDVDVACTIVFTSRKSTTVTLHMIDDNGTWKINEMLDLNKLPRPVVTRPTAGSRPQTAP